MAETIGDDAEQDDDGRLRRAATYASVGVALTLIAAKLAAYLYTESVSILSSLIDSSSDLLASVVTLLGVRVALRPPDRSHRYGHGKAEPLAALAQAAFVAGSAVFLTYEAINRLFNPVAIQESSAGIAVMVFSIVLTVGLVAFQRRVIRRTGSMAIGADSLHYSGDLFMNLAVIAALVLTGMTGIPILDPLFALGIAAFLIVGAFRIAKGSLDTLMDRELPHGDRKRIREIVMAHPATRGMHDLRTRNAGITLFIELHLELDSELTLAEAHDITDEVECRLTEAFPQAEVIVHQEPFGLSDDRLDTRIAEAGRLRRGS
ncbi:cation diffusion facilitator family transporter [Skermanella sp. TT6]|uniref:Cation diffusion facilitator family transporter n=1 Tax=Skermanella cutis TaxID=2775420 RepID=A0ABX7B391_9PROT|nr:cation diffusion facilitator family transporter [Skermanella sp. TT6]QQP88109.1 cation diffusion facilitator family transporter [Skermanella sp. TT6]